MSENADLPIIDMHKIKFDPKKHIRIDRRTIFGNPYPMESEKERNLVCDQFQIHFNMLIHEDQFFRDAVWNMAILLKKGFKLACWCYSKEDPKRCHAFTYLDYLKKKGLI